MECRHCKSSWNSSSAVTNCPFCGMSLVGTPENLTISAAIGRIIGERGAEILNDAKSVISLITDYVVGNEKDKKLLRIASQNGIFSGCYKIYMCADIEQRAIMIQQMVAHLVEEAFLSTEKAEYITSVVLEGVGVSFDDIGEVESENTDDTNLSYDRLQQDEIISVSDANQNEETTEDFWALTVLFNTFFNSKDSKDHHKLLPCAQDLASFMDTADIDKAASYADKIYVLAEYPTNESGYDLTEYEQSEFKELAKKTYLLLANRGQAHCQVCYAMLYADDSYEAFEWYMKAAKQANAVGQYFIADCYETGKGASIDPVESFMWYYRASQNSEVEKYSPLSSNYIIEAQYKVGWCYENGAGAQKNIEYAMKFYSSAANKGHEEAKKALERLSSVPKKKRWFGK